MKLIAIILIASVHLFASSTRTAGLGGCGFSKHPDDVPKPYLRCTDLQHSSFPFIKSYAKARSLKVSGNFSRLRISPLYKKLKYLTIFFHNEVTSQFSFQDYRRLRRLREVLLYTNSLSTLNFTGVEKQKWLENFQIQNTGEYTRVSSCQGLKNLKNLKTLSLSSVTTFDMSCLPASLQSFGLQYSADHLISAESLQQLTNLRLLSIYSQNFTFDLGDLPSGLLGLDIISHGSINEFRGCDRLRNLTNVSKLRVERFPPNILQCLPPNLSTLIVKYNDDVTAISDELCDYLQHLPHLRKVDMSRSKLQTFNLSCLHDKVQYLDISYNQITNIDYPFESNSTDLRQRTIYAVGNPINCTCQFIIDWFQAEAALWDNNKDAPCKNEKCCTFNCISCSPDSQLAHYPWSERIETITRFDIYPDEYNCLSVYDAYA